MEKVYLILMKGISCSSKSTLVPVLEDKYKAKVLSSDTLRQELNLSDTDSSVFKIITNKIHEYLSSGISVIVDATNLTAKKHNHYKAIANKHKASLICHYVITHTDLWERNAKNRIDTLWHDYSMDRMFEIRQSMYQALRFPTSNIFDEIHYHINDISDTYSISERNVNRDYIEWFKSYYCGNKEVFLNNTYLFFDVLKSCGFLQIVLPEVYNMYGFDQQNKHHTLTLEKHTFKVCENLEDKTEVMIWAGLLHDVGKLVKGIKREKEEGNFSYIGHAGASTELTMCILTRLGFSISFAEEVANIVNLHMYLPYEGELKQSKINQLGEKTYEQLKQFRDADKNAK